MTTRADPPLRFRVKDEKAGGGIGGVRFNAAGTWNYTSSLPAGNATYQIDPTFTLDGQPVLRIDMTDDCTQAWVGVTTGKTFTLPKDWNGEFAAVYCVPDKYTSIKDVTLFLNDIATTSNYNKTVALNTGIVWAYSGWRTQRFRNIVGGLDYPGLTNAPVAANMVAGRLRINKTSGAGTACSFYVAWIGIPAKSRPQVMFTFDHGTIGQYQRLFGTAVSKGVPIVIGIQSDPIQSGTGGTHMNGVQLQEMYNHPSGLCEFYAYSRKVNGTKISDQGLTNYLADYDTCATYLRSLGVKNPTLYHPYPFGDYTDELMGELINRGCKIARRADGSGARTNDTANVFAGKQMLSMDISLSPGVDVDITQAKATFDASLSAGEHIVSLTHVIKVAGDYNPLNSGWPIDYVEALFDHALLRQKQGLCDIVGAETFFNRLSNPRFSKQ